MELQALLLGGGEGGLFPNPRPAEQYCSRIVSVTWNREGVSWTLETAHFDGQEPHVPRIFHHLL